MRRGWPYRETEWCTATRWPASRRNDEHVRDAEPGHRAHQRLTAAGRGRPASQRSAGRPAPGRRPRGPAGQPLAGAERMTMAARITAVARFARRIAGVMAEVQYAQRRMTSLTTSADLYLADGDHVPDTYAEFLFRTSGLLLHEPDAAGRAHRQPAG